jgi:hypothetical protein
MHDHIPSWVGAHDSRKPPSTSRSTTRWSKDHAHGKISCIALRLRRWHLFLPQPTIIRHAQSHSLLSPRWGVDSGHFIFSMGGFLQRSTMRLVHWSGGSSIPALFLVRGACMQIHAWVDIVYASRSGGCSRLYYVHARYGRVPLPFVALTTRLPTSTLVLYSVPGQLMPLSFSETRSTALSECNPHP